MSDREDAMTKGSTPDDGDELAPTWTHDGHLDEGTIHTWLDGAFDASHAATIDAHVSTCAVCSANVAEARGLIAGASRMVRSLDVVPSGVVPQEDAARTASRIVAAAMAHAPSGQRAEPVVRRAARPWYLRAEWRAAAALVVMVGGGAYVWSRSPAALPTATAVQAERDTFDSAIVPQSSPPMATSAAPTETLADVRTARPHADDNQRVPLRRAPDQQAKVAASAPPATGAASPVGRSEATAARAVVSTETRAAERAAPSAEVVAGMRVAGGVANPTENRLRDSATRDSATRELATRDLVARDFASRESVRDRLIIGRVVSQQELPIEGAAVSIVGTTLGVMTDARGEFALRSLGDSASLQVRRLGYESARLSLRTPPNDTARANVTLKASNQTLSAVTVTSESQPLPERRQVGAALAGSPTPAARTASAPASVPAPAAPAAPRAMAPSLTASGRVTQCWELRPSEPSTADMGSPTPRAVLLSSPTADVDADRELSSQWVNWPIEGRNTSIPFVRDVRGRYRGTAIGAGVRWTLELTRRGTAWEVLVTRVAPGVEQQAPASSARYIMSAAADRVCKF